MQWYFLLGVATGARTMTGIAVVCWAAWLGLIPEHGWAVWITYLASAIVFTVLAIGEYIGDTLPRTPSRKSPGAALARLIFGALVGALVAWAIYEPIAGGVLVGVLGALVGTFGGYRLRLFAARLFGSDLPAALGESAIAILLAVWSVYEIHLGVLVDLHRGAW